jgi:hypothetical protein
MVVQIQSVQKGSKAAQLRKSQGDLEMLFTFTGVSQAENSLEAEVERIKE